MDAMSEFHAAEHAKLEAEIRLGTIRAHISHIDKEIATLYMVESNLVDNINMLKDPDTIPMIEHFKKAKNDLKLARTRISVLSVDRNQQYQVQLNAEKTFENAKKRYQQALLRIKKPYYNVIRIDFGSK